MSDRVLKKLNPRRYTQLFDAAVGGAFAFALCDSDLRPVWTREDSLGLLSNALSELERISRESEIELDAKRLSHFELDASRTLIASPVVIAGSHATAWLLVLLENQNEEVALRARHAAGAVAACLAEDYRVQAEANDLARELSDRYEELNLAYSLNRHSRELHSSLRGVSALLEDCAQFMRADVAAFVSPKLREPVCVRDHGHRDADLTLVLGELGGSLLRFIESKRETVIIRGSGDPLRTFLFKDLPFKVMACPVLEDGFVQSVLVLLRGDDKPDFVNSDRNLVTLVADQIGIAFRNHSLFEELSGFGSEMAGALIEAVEAKDPYTRGHSERVQFIAADIGMELGLPTIELDHLSWGALLHDVGKIGVPDSILRKPSTLTEDEYALIKTHAEVSYDILRHVRRFSASSLAAARHHHERFDGAGYPLGLAAKQIPLLARIITVADSYDAMTSTRAYRGRMHHHEALAEVRRCTGTQFDPDIVRAFEVLCERDPSWIHDLDLPPEGSDE